MNFAEMIRDCLNKMNKLIETAKTEKRDLSDEEQKVFNDYEKEIENYKAAAAREEKINQIKNDLATPATPSNQPRIDVKDDKNKFGNFGEMLVAVKNFYSPNGRFDNRLMPERIQDVATGMSVTVSSDGGFMVGAENESMLMTEIMEQSQVYPRITKLPVAENRNGTTLPALAETSRADGSRFGGVLAYWTPEAGTATTTKPKIREIDIKLSKLLAFCYMTDELMADARTLEAFVRKAYGAEMAYKLDDAIINGDGKGIPLGILNSASLISVTKEAGQAADTVVYENIIKMWSRLRARSKPRSVWLINQEVEPELFSMTMTVGAGGVPVYMPAGGISGAPHGTLFGRPVITIEQCPKLGDVGDVILADLSDYIGIDKGGLATDSSIHVQFAYDESCFRFRYRFNGLPYSNSALTSAKNSSFTTSPYITIAAR